MKAPDRPLFRAHPVTGRVTLSTGVAPTPYHAYDGHGLLIGGSASLDAVRECLSAEHVRPVESADGRAIVALWICAFTRASLGPHHECQLSIFVSREQAAPLVPSRLAAFEALIARPDLVMMCREVWNDTAPVVAFNREHLGLDAHRATGGIERTRDELRFGFQDATTDAPVASGVVGRHSRSSARATFGLIRRVGLWRLVALGRAGSFHVPVMNPVGPFLGVNAIADSYSRSASSVLRYFDPRHDRVVLGSQLGRALDFVPGFVCAFDGFEFVYRSPARPPAATDAVPSRPDRSLTAAERP